MELGQPGTQSTLLDDRTITSGVVGFKLGDAGLSRNKEVTLMGADKEIPALTSKAAKLELLVHDIERARSEAEAQGHQFLSYLLEMAHIEAVEILQSGRSKKP